MRVSLVTLCSGLAAVALAEAVPVRENRPRYYFPRVIKRQGELLGLPDNLFNTTTTPDGTSTSSDGLLPVGGNTDTAAQSTVNLATVTDGPPAAPTDDPSQSSVTVGLSGVITPTPAGDSSAPTSTDPLSSLLNPDPATTTPPAAATTLPPPVTTDSPVPVPTTTTPDLLTTLSSVVSSLTDPPITTTPIPDPLSTTLPDPLTTTPIPDPLTTTPIPDPLSTTSLSLPISTPDPISTTPIPDPISTTSIPDPISTTPIPDPISTTTPDPISTTTPNPDQISTTTPGGPISTTSPNPDSISTTTPNPDSISTTTPNPGPISTTTPVPDPVSSTTTGGAGPTSTTDSDGSTSAPVTIKPTATNTDTALPAESSIVSATSPKASGDSPTSTPSTIPTTLPSSIQPQGGIPQAPSNGTLVQLGFTYGLNYPFVVQNAPAVQQIFEYLPAGVANGVSIDSSSVIMQYLQPYNTLGSLGYITTLAMAYVPPESVNALSLALLNPHSALYNNANPAVNTLMNMLDPSIPLIAGSSLGNGQPVNSANSDGSGSGNTNGAAAGNDDTTSSSSVKPSSVGIGLGVVGGAAVYGAAMFLVAKRYKKRKAAHRRTSSLMSGSQTGGPQMAENTTLMTGARNSYGSRQPGTGAHGRDSRNSDRSQQTGRTYISPPVNAENSLGWN